MCAEIAPREQRTPAAGRSLEAETLFVGQETDRSSEQGKVSGVGCSNKPSNLNRTKGRAMKHVMGRVAALAIVISTGGALTLGHVSYAADKASADKMPITTKSEEAKQLYLKGLDLLEKLRATDAHKFFEQAVAKDPDFALAELQLANTSPSAKEFFDHTARAVALASKVSPAEQLLITSADLNARGQIAKEHETLTKLVTMLPNDERAHNALAACEFGAQEYAAAIAEYQKAVAINPKFSQPYNQLGYAYRFTEKYSEAEGVFKKYIELIPDDPNPYDSYAELLMKMGRFDESIKNYQKALSIDPNFIASYIGIANDQIFLDRGNDARATLAKLTSVARTDGEKRQALFWTAVSWAHEGQYDKALAAANQESAIAVAQNDLANLSADHNFMGALLLENGKADEALAQFKQAVEIMDKSDSPAEVKAATHRNALFNQARAALIKKDLATAKTLNQDYAKQVAEKKVPAEVRQQHELAGLLAIEEKQFATAVTELQQANQQDPRVLYLLAVALDGKGDHANAKTYCTRAADFNGLAGNYAYVRRKAKELLTKLS